MASYRAVVFDFFGTLTQAVDGDSTPKAVAGALGCDAEALASLLARTYPARARGAYGDGVAEMRRLARMLGHTPSAEGIATAIKERAYAIRASIRLRADAIDTLWTLKRAGLRTGLVSDCTGDVPPMIIELPIAGLLDVMVFSVHLGVSKPDPSLFLAASRRLGVRPDECLYIGDGGGRELSGARATGMAAVRLVVPDLADHLVHDPEPEWDGPTVGSLRDVVSLIGEKGRM